VDAAKASGDAAAVQEADAQWCLHMDLRIKRKEAADESEADAGC